MPKYVPAWAEGSFRICPADNPGTWWIKTRKRFLGIPYWTYFKSHSVFYVAGYKYLTEERNVYYSITSAKAAIDLYIENETARIAHNYFTNDIGYP